MEKATLLIPRLQWNAAFRALATLAVMVALAIPAPAASQEAPVPSTASTTLSLENAVALAREHNPAYLAQLNDLGVARWSVRSAYADFLPSANASTSFGYTASGERRFGSVEFGTQPDFYSSDYNLGLSLQLDGSKLLQPRVASAESRATRQRVEGAEANLVADVTQQYLTVLQSQEAVDQAEREVARTEEQVGLAEARLEVGAGTSLDVRRAEVQQGEAQIRLLQAQNTLATSMLQLGQLLGTPLEPDARLTSEFAVFEPQFQVDELIDAAAQNNPGLLSARATAQAAGVGVSQARSSYLPSLSFNVGVRGSVYEAGDLDPLISDAMRQAAGSFESCTAQNQIRTRVGLDAEACINPADPTVAANIREQIRVQNTGFPFDYIRQPLSASMTISLPIYTGLQRKVQIEQAEANAADARHQARSTELQLQADVSTAVRSLETAYQTVQIQDRVRATAEEELRLAQERFRFGAGTSIEVTDAQTNLSEAERALIAAVYDFHKQLAALEALVGQQLR